MPASLPGRQQIASTPSEADTCRKYVTPNLVAAGWDAEPHSLAEQRSFTDGRIVVAGTKAKRQQGKRAHYLLRYTPDFTIAVVEAKPESALPGDGLQQAKEYAEILGLKFAYSTNGPGIVEFDYLTGVRCLGSFDPVVTSGPRNWAEKCGQGAIRFYRAQDLGPNGRISHRSKAYISPPDNGQAKAAKLMAGDVMMVITGATVGRCAVFSASDEPGFVNQHVALCRLPQTEVDPDFVRWALLAPQGQEQLLGKRYGQGKPGLNLKNIRELTIPAAPLEEQKRIVERLDSTAEKMSGLRSAMVAASDEFKSLLPSVLNQAFSGKL